MTRCPVHLAPLFVKPMRATALSAQRATRRSPWRSIRFEVVGDNSLVFMDYMFPGIRETTALLPIRGGSSAVASRHHRNNALVRPQHVAVRRHKVTTLEHLFGARASRFGQEIIMAGSDLAAPNGQSSLFGEKTFTRRRDDKLRSHPSCISTRGAPLTNGAADVSGR
jgi:hypothetical protein